MISCLIAAARGYTTAPPAIWAKLLELFPALRAESIQVLIFLVVPLLLLLALVIASLAFRRRIVRNLGSVTFRPSLAIRLAWLFAISALAANLLFHRNQNWFLLITNLLALFELIRTFPRDLTIDANGLEWRSLSKRVYLRWESVTAFALERSLFGTDYKLYGNEDQIFVINTLENPDWKRIVHRISSALAQRHLSPSLSPPHNFLESLHRVLLPASLLISLSGPYLPHF